MTDQLFVYGTLALGQPNEHILGNIGGSWNAASVTGYLRDKGWGAEMGYPGIILSPKGQKVEGFVFASAKLIDNWCKLDEFEGNAYERVIAKVTLPDESTTNAYIYVLREV